jgi:hypothetical protein
MSACIILFTSSREGTNPPPPVPAGTIISTSARSPATFFVKQYIGAIVAITSSFFTGEAAGAGEAPGPASIAPAPCLEHPADRHIHMAHKSFPAVFALLGIFAGWKIQAE